MRPMNTKARWEKVNRGKDPVTDLSWYQAVPTHSLELIEATGLSKKQAVITPWQAEQRFARFRFNKQALVPLNGSQGALNAAGG
jgi:hypothetical protein